MPAIRSYCPHLYRLRGGGEIFAGWYSDAARTQAIDDLYIVPNEAVTVYAKWAHVEKGSAINFLEGLTVNEAGHYTLTVGDDGTKLAPTAAKTAFSYVYSPIDVPINGYTLLHVRYQGTKDQSMIVKLEGGNVPAIEKPLTFDGEVQELLWNVPAENIATEEGQRILIFVDGTETGNEAGTEVTIFSLEFCRLIGDGETEKQVILFNSMGGSKVLPLLAVKDADITLPTDVDRPGYTFGGWYTDKECEHEFTATKMPAGPTVLYAKWNENKTHNVTFVTNCGQTVDPMEIKVGDNIPAPELKVEGWRFLGWYESDDALEPHNLVMPDKDLTLYARWLTLEQLSDKTTKQSLLGLDWTSSGNDLVVNKETDKLTLKLNTAEAADLYASATLELADDFANALHIKVTGAQGDSLVFIYNGKVEKTIALTGTAQELWVYLDKQIASGELRLKPVRGEGQTATQDIVITTLELYSPTEKSIRVDTLGKWAAYDSSAPYTVTDEDGAMVITANTLKTGWNFVRYLISELPAGAALENAYRINLTYQGPAGHNILLKLNNDNAMQHKLDLDGSVQEYSVDIDGFVVTTDNVLIMFFDSGAAVTEDWSAKFFKFEILFKVDTKEYETKTVDLMTDQWENNNPGAYTFSKNGSELVATVQAPKGQFDVMRLDLTDFETAGAQEFKVSLTGPEGIVVLFKYNNDNGTEQKFTLSGTRQDIVVRVAGLDVTKNKYLQVSIDFPNSYVGTDKKTTVTFHSMQLECKVAK